MKTEDLRREPERTICDYSFSWEGEREIARDEGDVLVREIPVRWSGVNGMVVRMDFDPVSADARLDQLFREFEGDGRRRFLWIVGPSTKPEDVGDRLEARGMVPAVTWDGMVTDDLSTKFDVNLEVIVEPLSYANAEGFAAVRSYEAGDEAYAERLAAARRYLDRGERNCLIYVGRVGDRVAGHVILRVEPEGVAYFRDAFTLPEFRQHGVYLALVAQRLRAAREHGCTAGCVQANQQTSSPILQKRGWQPVCRLVGYAMPSGEGGGW